MKQTYTIPTFKMETFNKRINKMSNKAKRLGLNEYKVEIIEEKIVEVVHQLEKGSKEIVNVSFTVVTVEGEAPTVEGYKIIAMLEQFEDQNIVKRFDNETESRITTESLAKRSTECTHCGSKRARKYIFVLENENGELVQVGKSCLKDFTNSHYSAESIAKYYENTSDLFELENIDDEDYHNFGSHIFLHELDDVLALSIFFTDRDGYKPSSFKIPTSRDVSIYMFEKNKFTEYATLPKLDEIKEMTKEKIQEVKEYYAGLETTNDYTYNLQVLLSGKYTKGKYFGYIVSAYSSYLKALGREKVREAKQIEDKAIRKPSEYVGEAGQRKDFSLMFDKVVSYDSFYGVGYLYFFLDEQENVLMWSTSKRLDLESGDKVEILGTIKEHNEYNGIKQTIITRCKIK